MIETIMMKNFFNHLLDSSIDAIQLDLLVERFDYKPRGLEFVVCLCDVCANKL